MADEILRSMIICCSNDNSDLNSEFTGRDPSMTPQFEIYDVVKVKFSKFKSDKMFFVIKNIVEGFVDRFRRHYYYDVEEFQIISEPLVGENITLYDLIIKNNNIGIRRSKIFLMIHEGDICPVAGYSGQHFKLLPNDTVTIVI